MSAARLAVAPCSMISPAYITATRSQTALTTPRLWVISKTRDPARSRRSANRSRIIACTDTSSEAVGSSAISTLGSSASARAMATRCRWPPDSARGRTVGHLRAAARLAPAIRWHGARTQPSAVAGERAAARPGNCPRCGGGSGCCTDPGTPSGSREPGIWRVAAAAKSRPVRSGPGTAPARPGPWPAWTCRSRIRRPGRGSQPRSMLSETSLTALTAWRPRRPW